MSSQYRSILPLIEKDLEKKMVLLAGPRQCGKTTLAKSILKKHGGTYYSWDIASNRSALKKMELETKSNLWVFDEIHKFRSWRNWLKGTYDEFHNRHSILVTGSAKLDIYSHGGDSLQGRYFFHRLHPFTLSELTRTAKTHDWDIAHFMEMPILLKKEVSNTFHNLLELSGFPEPFFSGEKKESRRWALSYHSRMIQDEIRSLEFVKELDKIESMVECLPAVVGGVLSMNSLREDLEVSFDSVKHWLNILEKLYSCFRIPPFGPPKLKAVKKEQKLYLWNWSIVDDLGARNENLVAFHLLRLTHWCEDVLGEKVDLRYFRTVVGHEVDFVLLRKGKPWLAIEVKSQEQSLSPNLKYFLERVQTPYAFQLHFNGKKDYELPKINGCKVRVLPAELFLSNLP